MKRPQVRHSLPGCTDIVRVDDLVNLLWQVCCSELLCTHTGHAVTHGLCCVQLSYGRLGHRICMAPTAKLSGLRSQPNFKIMRKHIVKYIYPMAEIKQ